MNYLKNANYIKSLLIDLKLRKVPYSLLGSEVKFGKNGAFADLICLHNKRILSYEIKAYNDDLRNIKHQLTCYKKIFDYVYLVITDNHFKNAKAMIGDKVGMLIISPNETIEIYKEAKLLKRLNKEEILYSITSQYLQEYFNLSKMNALQVRSTLLGKGLEDLKRSYYNYLVKKLNPKNELFNSEKGIKTHFEDIRLLSYNEKTHLL